MYPSAVLNLEAMRPRRDQLHEVNHLDDYRIELIETG